MTSVSASKQHIHEIRKRMQAIRSDLPSGMEEAREDASNLTDWKFYVRTYPHVLLPAVAFATFSMVPPKKKTAASKYAFLDSDEGVHRVRLVEDEVPKKSIVSGVVGSLFALALRSGSTIAVRQLSQMLHGPRNTD